MPFRKHARITVENLSPDEVRGFYYQINYTLTDVPEDRAYLHAQWRRSNPLPYRQVHTLLDGVRGQGQYVGTYLAWGVNNNGWWGEGEIKFYLDGDGDWPTICGTGTEDYFGGAWNFEHPKGEYGVFSTPFSGLPQVIKPDGLYQAQQRFGLYRWHVMDPIRFQQDLRVTIQALGWRSQLQRPVALPAAAGRHRLDGLLVPDRAARAVPDPAGCQRARSDLKRGKRRKVLDMQEKVKVGIVGCGNISPAYFKGCRAFNILEVVACADLDPQRARRAAEEFGVARACSVAELLADPDDRDRRQPDHPQGPRRGEPGGDRGGQERPLREAAGRHARGRPADAGRRARARACCWAARPTPSWAAASRPAAS